MPNKDIKSISLEKAGITNKFSRVQSLVKDNHWPLKENYLAIEKKFKIWIERMD